VRPQSLAGQPGSRRVIVKGRHTRIVRGDLGAARAHIKYILRDGVTRDGMPGQLYDAAHNEADGPAFLDRSGQDPHQFRFIVSPEEQPVRFLAHASRRLPVSRPARSRPTAGRRFAGSVRTSPT
jgi:type IV secretory pathway VirD2 relaxase